MYRRFVGNNSILTPPRHGGGLPRTKQHFPVFLYYFIPFMSTDSMYLSRRKYMIYYYYYYYYYYYGSTALCWATR
jgi:hypothetical protein